MPDDDQLREALEARLAALRGAIERGRSRSWKLRLWSGLVRARDLNRCVYCKGTAGLAAHHIIRKCVLPEAELETGNGITLCRECHSKVHLAFNGPLCPGEPLNARSGDDQDYMQSLYHALERDGTVRRLPLDDYYYLGDATLLFFKRLQGLGDVALSGARVSQAHRIWQSAPVGYYRALAEMLGAELLTAWQRGE